MKSAIHMGGGKRWKVARFHGAVVSTDNARRLARLKFCDCGVETPLMTAKNCENQGRRFYGCGLYQVW